MGNIFDTIKALGKPDKAKEEWLKTNEYGVAAKKVGDKGYHVDPGGLRTEVCTLEALEEREDWASATVSFDDNGTKRSMTITIDNFDMDSINDFAGKDAKPYVSAVYTASGKLVHLAS